MLSTELESDIFDILDSCVLGYLSSFQAMNKLEELLKEHNVLKSQGPEQVLDT